MKDGVVLRTENHWCICNHSNELLGWGHTPCRPPDFIQDNTYPCDDHAMPMQVHGGRMGIAWQVIMGLEFSLSA